MRELKNLFTAPLKSSDEEYFDTLIDHRGSCSLKRIVSNGQTSPDTGWYCQDSEEWVCVLQGEAELTMLEKEGEKRVSMKAGDYLTIPAGLSHKVSYTSTAPACIWLALYMDIAKR
jgi:cupin 2 domain-containing protein